MAGESSYFKITKFDGHPESWDDFKFNFLNLCEMQDDLVDYVISNVEEPNGTKEKVKWAQKKSKSYAFLAVHLESVALVHIRNVERSGFVAWSALLSHYERKSVSNVIKLRMAFFSMRQNDDERAFVFAHRITALVSRLKTLGSQTADGDQCAVLLAGLTAKYESLVTALDLEDKLTFDSLVGKLRVFEDRVDRNGSDSSTVALVARAYKKNQRYKKREQALVCHNCGGKGHKSPDCPSERMASANIAGVTADFEYMEHDDGYPHQSDYDY
jgi:hypothetical protein